ncbi:MAG: biotin attachment protein [Acidothermus sp.]|nr:biotin attachment protein [Acidothermus sp.]MCL6537763.1 biotin attachment protein [Acidothermus sp.]
MFEVKMPQLGETVQTGTIKAWLKAVGDHVHADEPLLEVSSDKVDVEVPAQATGVLKEVRFEAGEEVAVGTVIALIE